MKLHTILRYVDIVNALRKQKELGNIAPSVAFDQLDEHKSRTHPRRFDVKLVALMKKEGDGRRRVNPGRRGPAGDADYAATYDEWGWFLAEVYRRDPNAEVPGVYARRGDFLVKTGYAYNPEVLLGILSRGEDPYPFVLGRVSGRVGRVGAGRSDGRTLTDAVRNSLMGTGPQVHTALDAFYRPRTLVEVAQQVQAMRDRERTAA